MRRVALLALVVLLATVALPTVAMPAAAQDDGTPTATPTPTSTATPASNTTAGPTANGTGGNASTGPVTLADQVRVSPVKFQADYLNVGVREADAAYNTTGEFAMFSLSERVVAARVTQKPAEAKVLGGGRQVKVEYQPNAAPDGGTSLYTLELFFRDGSSKTVRLYASATEQSVAAARLQEWAPVVDQLCQVATEHGYECNPDSVGKYITWVNERADLVDGFLTRQVTRFVGWVILGVRNPLTIIVVVVLIAAAAAYRQRKHGDILQALQQMAGRYETKVEKLKVDYERAKRTADDDDLADVPAIGSVWAQYWTDAYGVKSPLQLARLAAAGEERHTQDGLEQRHGGVDDLDPDDLRDGWLEPALRHIGDEKVVLNHLLRTFEWCEAEHNLGHHFRDARNRTEDLLDEVQRREEYPNASSGAGYAAGAGDD